MRNPAIFTFDCFPAVTIRTLTAITALCVADGLPAQQPDIGPAPGQLFDIGGRKLHMMCSGAGSPTIILEAGGSSFAIDWTLVQREVARTNRVCSYDRAGFGWSEPSSGENRGSVTSDLHSLLQASSVKPPYIMVGASAGGLYVREFQAEYPDEVLGLVLVDPSSEERLFTYFEGNAVEIASLTADQLRTTIPQRSVTVTRRSPQTGAPFDRLPKDLYDVRIKLDTRLIASAPDVVTYEIIMASAERERARLARLKELRTRQTHPLGDRPLVVLSRGVESSQGLLETHASLARLSTNSRHTAVDGAGHEIHLFEPNAVIQAIRDVVEATRAGTRLPHR